MGPFLKPCLPTCYNSIDTLSRLHNMLQRRLAWKYQNNRKTNHLFGIKSVITYRLINFTIIIYIFF